MDGVLFFVQRNARVGAILRNEQGEVIMVVSKVENEVTNPTTIEAVILRPKAQAQDPVPSPRRA